MRIGQDAVIGLHITEVAERADGRHKEERPVAAEGCDILLCRRIVLIHQRGAAVVRHVVEQLEHIVGRLGVQRQLIGVGRIVQCDHPLPGGVHHAVDRIHPVEQAVHIGHAVAVGVVRHVLGDRIHLFERPEVVVHQIVQVFDVVLCREVFVEGDAIRLIHHVDAEIPRGEEQRPRKPEGLVGALVIPFVFRIEIGQNTKVGEIPFVGKLADVVAGDDAGVVGVVPRRRLAHQRAVRLGRLLVCRGILLLGHDLDVVEPLDRAVAPLDGGIQHGGILVVKEKVVFDDILASDRQNVEFVPLKVEGRQRVARLRRGRIRRGGVGGDSRLFAAGGKKRHKQQHSKRRRAQAKLQAIQTNASHQSSGSCGAVVGPCTTITSGLPSPVSTNFIAS